MPAHLGRSLVFYLKYPAEMERLYGREEEPEGLEDTERTLEMVHAVGDAACRQVADFLEASGKVIQAHFTEIAKCQVISKRSALEKKWWIDCGVWMKGKFRPKPGKWKVVAGVSVEWKDGGVVVPWLWCPGKAAAEEQLVRVLGQRIQPIPADWDYEQGTAALAKIPILEPGQQGFDIDREPLLKKVAETFATIAPHDIQMLTLLNL